MKNTWIKLREKLIEALAAVLPIVGIVLVLSFSIAPISPSILLSFLMGAAMLIFGMMFFTQGAEMAMVPIGERVGSSMTRTKKVWLIVLVFFLLGLIITISEPALQVLANQVSSIPNTTLIAAVAIGVGTLLVLALLRMLFKVSLQIMLIALFSTIFLLAQFVPVGFLGVAFDAGGVTTGPMVVPFIMAIGLGVASVRTDPNAADDSFGLVALCSTGPIVAVLILGLLFGNTEGVYEMAAMPEIGSSTELWAMFRTALPAYFKELMIALLPIVVFFGVFQVAVFKMTRRNLLRICVGLVYTYIGLVLFLAGANVGFMPAGNYIAQVLAGLPYRWVIIPIGVLIGYFIVKAEPAVYVLNKQVEEITDGAISEKAMGTSLSIGVAVSVGLAMMRVLVGINILWFMIPGYVFALALTFFVPKLFTAIAFDSGSVASGAMTAAFLLPFAQGACIAVGGDMFTDAFGIVAMVAMTPLITVQLMGVIAAVRTRLRKQKLAAITPAAAFEMLDDDAIIDL